MSLLDSFKPKWKHSDPAVRADAVRRLTEQDAAILAEVAREDGDAHVRRVALKRIGEPKLLAELAEKDADEGNRRAAIEQLIEAACHGDEAHSLGALAVLSNERALADVAKLATHPSVGEAAAGRLNEPRLLGDVARRAAVAEVRRAATGRLGEVAILLEVALGDPDREVSGLALEKLSDPAALRRVAEEAVNRKTRASARARLGEEATEEAAPASPLATAPAEAIRYAKLSQLCRAVEQAAQSGDPATQVAAVESARKARAEMGEEPGDDEMSARFARALAEYQAAVTARERALADEAERVERERAEKAARAAAPAAAAPVAMEGEQPVTAPDAEAAAAARQSADEAAEAARKARENDERALVQRLEQICANLEATATTDDIKKGDRTVRRADEASRDFAKVAHDRRAPLRARFDAAREKVVIRLRELREAEEWKRWSNVPRLEELCTQMEALAAAEDLKQAAREMKTLQAEWRTLPPPRDKSEALWTRFKAASDQVYERCKTYFHSLDEERAQNLKLKEELCVRVEAVQDSEEWTATAELIKGIQEEWKKVGPVARDQTEVIWGRFRAACDRFFERRKAQFEVIDSQRADNARRLEGLVQKAESLADSTEWNTTADQLKMLQAEWKSVGPARRRQSEALWKRFRGACDMFFEKRKAHFSTLDEERGRNLALKQELIARAEAAAGTVEGGQAAELSRELMAEWKKVGPAPREQADAVWEKFRAACNRLRGDSGEGESRGPRPEGRGPRPEGRGPRPEGRGPRPEGRGPRPEGRGPRRDDRGPRREDRAPRADGGGPRGALLASVGGQFSNRLPLEGLARLLKQPDGPATGEPTPASPAAEAEVRPAAAPVMTADAAAAPEPPPSPTPGEDAPGGAEPGA